MNGVETLLAYKAVIVLAFGVGLFVLERAFPVARNPVKAVLARLAKNVSLFGVNAVMSPLVVIPLCVLAASLAPQWRPDWWSGVSGLALDLLILDLSIYWWHRLNHEWPFLWRFHEVHHLDEFLDVTSAVRFHFGEVFLSAIYRSILIFLLAMPIASVILFELLVLLVAMFHHSNVKLPAAFERVASWFIVTPSIHWVHHHAIRRDTDSNYATILSLWDKLFASRSAATRTSDMPIGVEKRHDLSLIRLALKPFWQPK
jgi:sterol desaturase/sphingolipid hydroxylase (fatty acid hydroxylase superfamily)